MTPTTKPTVRESSERISRRNCIVILGPGNLIAFRLKGTRKAYETTVGACYSMAVRQHVIATKAAKAAARKGRK